MSRTTRPAISVLAAATLAVGLVPAVAAAGLGPATVPDDWVELEDDTGLLTISTPAEWSDVAAVALPDTTEIARITAATDIEAYNTGFVEPGVSLVALPYTQDTTGVLDDALQAGCRVQGDSRYDDGAFVGVMRHWTSCGADGSTTEVYIVAVAPVNRSVTLLLIVQVTGPEQQDVVDGILASFNLTHLPDPPDPTDPTVAPSSTTTPGATSTAPATTTTPDIDVSTTVPPTTSTGGSSTTTGGPITPDEPQQLRDETGALLISVPGSWTDVNPRSNVRNDGLEIPNIAASPDLDVFLASGNEAEFTTPGVMYRALPYTEDTEATLRGITRLGCVDGGIQPYSDDLFTGHMWTFPACGGTSTRQFIVVANANDSSFTALLIIRLTEPGNQELQTVLGSFTYDSGAINSSPIATS